MKNNLTVYKELVKEKYLYQLQLSLIMLRLQSMSSLSAVIIKDDPELVAKYAKETSQEESIEELMASQLYLGVAIEKLNARIEKAKQDLQMEDIALANHDAYYELQDKIEAIE